MDLNNALLPTFLVVFPLITSSYDKDVVISNTRSKNFSLAWLIKSF